MVLVPHNNQILEVLRLIDKGILIDPKSLYYRNLQRYSLLNAKGKIDRNRIAIVLDMLSQDQSNVLFSALDPNEPISKLYIEVLSTIPKSVAINILNALTAEQFKTTHVSVNSNTGIAYSQLNVLADDLLSELVKDCNASIYPQILNSKYFSPPVVHHDKSQPRLAFNCLYDIHLDQGTERARIYSSIKEGAISLGSAVSKNSISSFKAHITRSLKCAKKSGYSAVYLSRRSFRYGFFINPKADERVNLIEFTKRFRSVIRDFGYEEDECSVSGPDSLNSMVKTFAASFYYKSEKFTNELSPSEILGFANKSAGRLLDILRTIVPE